MRAREREMRDLAGIFILLEITSGLLKTLGRDPPCVPSSGKESDGQTSEESGPRISALCVD